ncbi:MAG TPA: ABC transporter C-terminal domain-containing protein [Verrucomicrobiae bacterium]|nr:ABC transporter C-terminal domain-containing protein [Verrucomicrobiae bacterium]
MATAAPATDSPRAKAREQKRFEAEARQARSRERQALQHAVRELEKEIARLEQLQKEFTAELENPETYQKPGRAVAVNRELSSVVEDLARGNVDWEQAAERLGALDSVS